MECCVGHLVLFIDVFGRNPIVGLIIEVQHHPGIGSFYKLLSGDNIIFGDDTMIVEILS